MPFRIPRGMLKTPTPTHVSRFGAGVGEVNAESGQQLDQSWADWGPDLTSLGRKLGFGQQSADVRPQFLRSRSDVAEFGRG